MSTYRIRIKKKRLSRRRGRKEKVIYRAWSYITFHLKRAENLPDIWTTGVSFDGEVGKDAAEFDLLKGRGKNE